MTILDVFKPLLSSLRAGKAGAADDAQSNADRYTVRRRQRMREGFVSWPARPAYPPQLCSVEEVSYGGARIEVTGTLPGAEAWASGVRLYLAADDHEFDCRVAWQSGSQLGLQFQGRPQPPSRIYR